MGSAGSGLSFANRPPTVILMAGLQGSGKTTACGKLARLLAKQKRSPAMVACDLQRPAAVQQLQTLGKSLQVPVYERGTDADPVEVAAWGVEQARAQGRDVVIVDTAGRLHVDQELMDQLVRIKQATKPHNVLLVLDSMTGQDAVNVAQAFAEAVDYDGVILTKLDGDARGGAALAVRAVTGKPIKYVSVGEKLDQLEPFHPDRLASRILGMGDVMSLIERAQEQITEQDAKAMEAKLRKAEFTLEDFLGQLRQVRKMTAGQGMAGLLGMLPGVGRQVKNLKVDERQIDRVEAIILSMTPAERRNPRSIDGSRRRRIAAGQRHERAAGQPAARAVQADAEDDEADRAGQDAPVPGPDAVRRHRSQGTAGLRFSALPYPRQVRHGRDPLANPEPLIRSVYAFVAYRIGAGHDAEDVTGEVFERALRYRSGYDASKGAPLAWLIGIARNVLADRALNGHRDGRRGARHGGPGRARARLGRAADADRGPRAAVRTRPRAPGHALRRRHEGRPDRPGAADEHEQRRGGAAPGPAAAARRPRAARSRTQHSTSGEASAVSLT